MILPHPIRLAARKERAWECSLERGRSEPYRSEAVLERGRERERGEREERERGERERREREEREREEIEVSQRGDRGRGGGRGGMGEER